MGSVEALVHAWRDRIADLRRYGAEPQARALESAAGELEAALHAAADEMLTLDQAAHESGYTADHLARQIRVGKLANAGRPHAPRLRRADLPCKPGFLPPCAGHGTVADARRQAVRASIRSN